MKRRVGASVAVHVANQYHTVVYKPLFTFVPPSFPLPWPPPPGRKLPRKTRSPPKARPPPKSRPPNKCPNFNNSPSSWTQTSRHTSPSRRTDPLTVCQDWKGRAGGPSAPAFAYKGKSKEKSTVKAPPQDRSLKDISMGSSPGAEDPSRSLQVLHSDAGPQPVSATGSLAPAFIFETKTKGKDKDKASPHTRSLDVPMAWPASPAGSPSNGRLCPTCRRPAPRRPLTPLNGEGAGRGGSPGGV
ncbi:hypothetical protein FB451DRAFT_441866 [Mycena latifolia]|nr:hypothetical protein FB451DRAFT_441866 [Mycena latifolia]